MTRLSILALVTAAAAGCGGTHALEVVPRLPGTGDSNTDRPVAPRADGDGDEVGPWSDPEKLIQPPAPGPIRPLELPKIKELTLANGLGVVMVPDSSAPVVNFQVAVRVGRGHATRDKVGIAKLAAIMMAKGTRRRSASAIASAIETAGGTISADASYEATLVSCNVLSAQSRVCVDLLADMLQSPSFPTSEIDRARSELKAAIARQASDGAQLSAEHFQNQLWGDHPRGWPMSQRTVSAIERGDLVAWHRRHVVPANTVISIAGDFDPKSISAELKRRFGRWARRKAPARKAPKTPALSGIKIRLVDHPGESRASVRLGRTGLGHRDPAFFASLVANHILGAAGGRLDRALEAQVVSQLDRNLEPGSFVVSASVEPTRVVSAIREIRDQMGELARSGPSDEELAAATTQLAGGYAVRFQSATDIAGAVLAARLHEFDSSYVSKYPVSVRSVSADRVRAAATRLMGGDDVAIVIVGPAAVISKQLDKVGWKYQSLRFVDPVAPWERASSQKVARKILDEALVAKGGAKRLGALKSFFWSGTAKLSQQQGKMKAAVTKRYKAPGRLRLDMDITDAGVKLVTVMAGNTGWALQVTAQGKRAIDFPKAEVEAGKAQIWRDQDLVLSRHLEANAGIALVDETTVDKKPAYAIRVTSPDSKYSVIVLIDKASKLLVGMTYQERAPNGQLLQTQERYGNYKKISGLQIAHERSTRSAQIDLTTTLTKIEINKPIDDKLFVKPSK